MTAPSPAHSTNIPRVSSSQDLYTQPTGTLARLVAHFVAAKRALTSTSFVYRANEIVSSARKSLEDIATFSAQDKYLRRATQRQLGILKGIRSGLNAAAADGNAEFQTILKRLDAADADIQQTLQDLRKTMIEATFRPPDESPRSLHSFIDEHGVLELKAQFRECIDLTTEAHGDFEDLNEEFNAMIKSLEKHLEANARSGLVESIEEDGEPSTKQPAALFRTLEDHASEVAELLQSLVKHYDLCTTALKHTEGGGEAVHAAYSRSQKDTNEVDEAFEEINEHGLMSTEERAEMLAVLDGDAKEVDEAVREMRDHVTEMEGQLGQLKSQAAMQKETHSQAVKAVSALEDLSDSGKLRKYVNASQIYASRWAEIKSRINAGLEEFLQLATFFKGFQTAYQYLLLEIDRRRRTRLAMERVINDSQRAISDLFEAEDEKRKRFRQEYGEFLPADMWPPLIDPPTKWVIERNDDGTADIPTVRDESLKAAVELLRPRRSSKGG